LSQQTPRISSLAPFSVRAFRFQWPADLATSWAFEMETIILGWYMLVETKSVFMLTVFSSLLFVGTLFAPMFGVVGDRIGQRKLLCVMRSLYAVCAITLTTCAFLDILVPGIVLAVTAVVGLVRPSDIGMRSALVGEIMPPDRLVSAMGLQRITQDSARITGALTGAGLVVALGMGPAYLVVSAFYLTSIVLMLQIGFARARPQQTAGSAGNESARPRDKSEEGHASSAGTLTRSPQTAGSAGNESARPSPWRDLKEGARYVWNTPTLRAIMLLAFLLNLTAFPLFIQLLPVIAKEIYLSDRTMLSYMVAASATGALIGSIVISRLAHRFPAARVMILFNIGWYIMLALLWHTTGPGIGIPVLVLTGLVQCLGLVPSTATLLRNADEAYRGRVMGIRMLALYTNVPGLLISGPLIATLGHPNFAMVYCSVGILCLLLIVMRYKDHLWRLDAPANRR
jgi:MFS family permease